MRGSLQAAQFTPNRGRPRVSKVDATRSPAGNVNVTCLLSTLFIQSAIFPDETANNVRHTKLYNIIPPKVPGTLIMRLSMSPLLALLVLVVPGVQSLWPIPRSLHTGNTAVKLSKAFHIGLEVQSPPQDLLDAVSRTKSYLINDKHQVTSCSCAFKHDTASMVYHPSVSLLPAVPQTMQPSIARNPFHL